MVRGSELKNCSTAKLFISRQSITLLKESNSFGTRIENYKAWKIRIHHVCNIRIVVVHMFRAVFVIDLIAAWKNSEHESWRLSFPLQVPFTNFFVSNVGAEDTERRSLQFEVAKT